MRITLRRTREGQSLVEFSLVLVPLLVILLGIAQFGFIFNAYVTVANATREGARAGSIWVPDPQATQAVNDSGREAYVRDAVTSTMGILPIGSANFVPASDVQVTYSYPTNASCPEPAPQGAALGPPDANDTRRKGHYVCVAVTYHLDLFIPIIADILGPDSNGQMNIPAFSQMVIN